MNLKPVFTINEIAAHLGLTIKYCEELPPNAPGHLDQFDPPKYIALDPRQPHCEQVFTFFHEVGHLLLHRRPGPRMWLFRLVNRKWNNHLMAVWMRASRRYYNRNFNREVEADAIATVFLFNLRYTGDLREYIERHPEKTWSVLFFMSLCIYGGLKRRFVSALKQPFTRNPTKP